MVIVSGYFNPLHKGHIEYINKSSSYGDFLIAIINSDLQVSLKKSKKFMCENERLMIVKNLKSVDNAIISIDSDRTVQASILMIYNNYKDEFDFIFTNGGDQFFEKSPEFKLCKKLDIQMIDGMGKKIQSSSNLLNFGYENY